MPSFTERRQGRQLLTPEQQLAPDLSRTTTHEVAHAALGGYFGARTRVGVRAHSLAGDAPYFEGAFTFADALDTQQHRVLALAGILAEYVLVDRDATDDEIVEWLRVDAPTQLSDADRGAAGDYTDDDVRATLALVRDLWPDIRRDAEEIAEAVRADPEGEHVYEFVIDQVAA